MQILKSPWPNYIGIESLDGRTMPERRSADDRRISWHPTVAGRSPTVTAGPPTDRPAKISVIRKVNRAAAEQSPGGGRQTSGA